MQRRLASCAISSSVTTTTGHHFLDYYAMVCIDLITLFGLVVKEEGNLATRRQVCWGLRERSFGRKQRNGHRHRSKGQRNEGQEPLLVTILNLFRSSSSSQQSIIIIIILIIHAEEKPRANNLSVWPKKTLKIIHRKM